MELTKNYSIKMVHNSPLQQNSYIETIAILTIRGALKNMI